MGEKKNKKQPLFPTEVAAGALAFLAKKNKLLSSRLKDIHPIFYEMRQQGLSVLNEFRFDTRDIYPYSETLDQAMSNLLASKSIWYTGPNLNVIEIDDNLTRYFEKYVKPKLNRRQIKELQQIARALLKICVKTKRVVI